MKVIHLPATQDQTHYHCFRRVPPRLGLVIPGQTLKEFLGQHVDLCRTLRRRTEQVQPQGGFAKPADIARVVLRIGFGTAERVFVHVVGVNGGRRYGRFDNLERLFQIGLSVYRGARFFRRLRKVQCDST
jgi:hypothetical protein